MLLVVKDASVERSSNDRDHMIDQYKHSRTPDAFAVL